MSEYGEVKDLLDKITLYSNLRLQAYECGVHSDQGGTIRDEADLLLKEIEKELELLMHAYDALRYSAGRST